MTQLNPLDLPPEPPRFDGVTYCEEKDGARLTSQLERVRAFMSDFEWHDLEVLRINCGGSTASVSSRVRDLRKAKHGGHTIETRRSDWGWWEYRLVPGSGKND